jgi:hypothetical protein
MANNAAGPKGDAQDNRESMTQKVVLILFTALVTWLITAGWEWFTAPGAVFNVRADHGPFFAPQGREGVDWESRNPSLNGLIRLSIKNDGDRPAEQVELQIQGQGIISVQRSDGSFVSARFKDRHEIGRLATAEVVEVSLWTERQLSPEETIEISHSVGLETVILGEQSMKVDHSSLLVFSALIVTMALSTSVLLLSTLMRGFKDGVRGTSKLPPQ